MLRPMTSLDPARIARDVDDLAPSLRDVSARIHAHPELSHFEEHTSALLAEELRKAGYNVTEHIGKYPDGSQAYGVVAILKNGPGPVVMPDSGSL